MSNESFDYWKTYISTHPEAEPIVDTIDIHYSSYGEFAPYMDGWVGWFQWNAIIFSKYKFNDQNRNTKNDSWHRVDGPAYISCLGEFGRSDYYINGVRYEKEDWKKLPEVIMITMDECIRDILDRDE